MRSRLLTVLSLAVLSFFALLLPTPALHAQTRVLAPTDALRHAGQQATVCGSIVATRRPSTLHGLPTFVDLGQTLPSPAFTVILWDSDRSRIGNFPTSGRVCVTGAITQYKGVPQMVVEDATSWSLPPAPARPPATPVAPIQPQTPALHSPATANQRAVNQSPIIPLQPSHIQPSPPAPSASSALTASASPTSSPAAAPPSVRTDPSPAIEPSSIPPSPIPASYRIGADDSLEISVWQEPNLSGTFLVRPDGMISLVLAGEVRAAGLTPPALAADLTERFQKYLQDPLVSVIVVAPNSQKIYMLGEVQHVGPIPMTTAMSPLQAIAAAGGLTPYAKPKKIYILRGPQGSQRKIPFNYKAAVNAKPSASIHLLAGDTIVVP